MNINTPIVNVMNYAMNLGRNNMVQTKFRDEEIQIIHVALIMSM